MHLAHLSSHKLASQIQAASASKQLDEDRKSDAARPHALLPHFGEELQPQLQVASLDTTLEQRVVHDLITFEFSSTELLGKSHRLIKLAVAAIPFDKCAEGDQVRSHSSGCHLLQHLCCAM